MKGKIEVNSKRDAQYLGELETPIMVSNYDSPIGFAFDITGRCNFKCLHCYNESGSKPKDELNHIELLDVAKQIADFKCLSVCLCGGEPLISESFFDIVRILRNNCGVLNVVSNGSLITEEVALRIKNEGINLVQISLDGSNEIQHDTFRGYPGAFEKAILAIKRLKNIGVSVAISTIPNKLNYKSIEQLVKMCIELGVTNIRSMPLIPEGRGSIFQELILSSEEYFEYTKTLLLLKEKYENTGVLIEWGDPVDHFWRMPILAEKGYKTHSMEVKPNGDIAISTYIPLVVGNVRNHTLKEYWDNGYSSIWANEKVKNHMSSIHNIYDINILASKLYSKHEYYLPLFD